MSTSSTGIMCLWSKARPVRKAVRHCGILNIWQPHRPPQHVLGIALLFTIKMCFGELYSSEQQSLVLSLTDTSCPSVGRIKLFKHDETERRVSEPERTSGRTKFQSLLCNSKFHSREGNYHRSHDTELIRVAAEPYFLCTTLQWPTNEIDNCICACTTQGRVAHSNHVASLLGSSTILFEAPNYYQRLSQVSHNR
jgi:hypothetical protein